MAKYFYTNAIAVEWMGTKYGMRFTMAPEDEGSEIRPDKLRAVSDCLGKTYVHRESRHILQPCVDDIIRYGQGLAFVKAPVENGELKVCVFVGAGFGQHQTWTEKLDSVVVIERGGLPFFWPES